MEQVFRLHYTLPCGTDDYIVLQGETVESVREQFYEHVKGKNAKDFWSEMVEE